MASMTRNAAAPIAPLGRALVTVWCGILGRFARHWQRRRALRALSALDDYMLKDIGLSRSMIESAVAERHSRF